MLHKDVKKNTESLVRNRSTMSTYHFYLSFTLVVHLYKNYDVRLTDGKAGSFEGRVEIYRVGTWGTICDDGWGHDDAEVVCRQLGYGGAKYIRAGSHFGEGRGIIWLDDLACFGNETSLGRCAHNGWGSHDCTHSQDAGVICDKGTIGQRKR